MGMIGVLEITLIVPTLWNASQDALECGADVCPNSSVFHVMRSAY